MPRKARIDAPGALHHVILRGIERKAIFKTDVDRNDFLVRLGHHVSATSTACFAWALMTNHVHLLIRTGSVPLATVMRRLLTGYAVCFNRRYRRHGQLFQNRYKSILCQQDVYLLELVRYIHLNPLRAGIVPGIKALNAYPYTGHSVLMGKQTAGWQDTGTILRFFGSGKAEARREYHGFVEKAAEQGRRPELVGGGLIRSAGGWKQARKVIKRMGRVKGDERILGDTDFVQEVLDQGNEKMHRSFQLSSKGIDINAIARYVGAIYDVTPEQILATGRYSNVVKARSVLCYWAVRELGITTTALAGRIGVSQPTISMSVKRGEIIVRQDGLTIEQLLK